MVSRPHLALVPAHGLRPSLSRPAARAAGVVAALVGLLGLLYLAARETPLFALRELEVSGAPPAVRAAVRDAGKQFVGESLVALDVGELTRTLEALPTVRSLQVDRSFPHTLRVAVTPERPLALLRRGQDAWLVSDRGRVIRKLEPGATVRRPRIRLDGAASVDVGSVLTGEKLEVALLVLRRVPAGFPVRVRAARVEDEEVVLVLAGGTELLLGERSDLRLKLAVAGRVLRTLPRAERRELAYLDVSVPDRPVGGAKSQL